MNTNYLNKVVNNAKFGIFAKNPQAIFQMLDNAAEYALDFQNLADYKVISKDNQKEIFDVVIADNEEFIQDFILNTEPKIVLLAGKSATFLEKKGYYVYNLYNQNFYLAFKDFRNQFQIDRAHLYAQKFADDRRFAEDIVAEAIDEIFREINANEHSKNGTDPQDFED